MIRRMFGRADGEGQRYTGVRPWRVSLVADWRDWWIGAYVDVTDHWLYFFPIPLVGVVVEWGYPVMCHHCGSRPAVVVCRVKKTRMQPEGGFKTTEYGYDYPRDALCAEHGRVGPCPMNDRATDLTWHVAIPADQQWTADWMADAVTLRRGRES